MRAVLSGGGTGGHIFPAVAIAESLCRLDPESELLFIGSENGMEARIVPGEGLPFQSVPARKLQKLLSPSTLPAVASLAQGYGQAKMYLKAFKADVVIGTGGYVAAAAVLAGVKLRIPTLICSPDAVPGRTNLLLARFVQRICIAFPESVRFYRPEKTVVTGMPLRASLTAPSRITQEEARAGFAGLRPERFTLLVTGGSQGARALNAIVLAAAPALLQAGVQIIHQTGQKNFEEVREEARQKGLSAAEGYLPLPFLGQEQMPLALRAASLMLCRGGVSSLSENLVSGLPALIVPLPTAYADHQTHNALALQRAGAALHLPQNDLTPETLVRQTLALKDDTALLAKMRTEALELGRPDAADLVAKEALALRKKA